MCLISHKHMDHHQYWGEFAAIMPTHIFKDRCESQNWKAFGIPLKHGEGQTMTFIIKSLVENKFIFFGTDIEFEPQNEELFLTLKKFEVENYLIECNYNDFLIHCEDVSDEMRKQCKRHLSDNNLINFIKKTGAKNPKIITIHGSNRLSADTYTKKYISSKLLNSTVFIAVGAKNNQKDLFNI